MKVVALYKWAENPQDVSVSEDGSIDWAAARAALSDYDPVAIEVACQVGAQSGAEVVALTVGGPDAASSMAKKTVLSRGPAKAVTVTDEEFSHLETAQTAHALADAIREIGDVDLAIAGASSIDEAAGLVPAVLAGLLGWPCVLEATSVTVQGDHALIERDGGNAVETLSVPLPAVVAMTADATQPRIPGMKDILGAAKKPAEALSVATPAVGPTLVSAGRPALKPRGHHVIDGKDAAAASSALVAELRGRAIL